MKLTHQISTHRKDAEATKSGLENASVYISICHHNFIIHIYDLKFVFYSRFFFSRGPNVRNVSPLFFTFFNLYFGYFQMQLYSCSCAISADSMSHKVMFIYLSPISSTSFFNFSLLSPPIILLFNGVQVVVDISKSIKASSNNRFGHGKQRQFFSL